MCKTADSLFNTDSHDVQFMGSIGVEGRKFLLGYWYEQAGSVFMQERSQDLVQSRVTQKGKKRLHFSL